MSRRKEYEELAQWEQDQRARGLHAFVEGRFGGFCHGDTPKQAYLCYLEQEHGLAMSEVDMDGPAQWDYPVEAYDIEAPWPTHDRQRWEQDQLDARREQLEPGVSFALIFAQPDGQGGQQRGRRGLRWYVFGVAHRVQRGQPH